MTTTTIGTYNVQHGHDPEARAAMIDRRFHQEGLRVLALTEVGDYIETLAHEPWISRLQPLWIDGPENVRSQALLVTRDARVSGPRSIPTPATYRAPDGTLRRSACPLAADVDGVLYVVIHAPVGAWITGAWTGRRFAGPLRRRLAYRRYMRRLLRIFRAHPRGHVVILGDWNATPDTRGRWSPDWLARKAGAHIIRPGTNTGHGEIDFAIVRGVHGTLDVRPEHPEPSDHRLVAGKITRRKANQ